MMDMQQEKDDRTRAEIMLRCFHTIMLLNSKNGITASMLAEKLCISKRSAYRYLAAASLALPVFETQKQPAIFKILVEDDFPKDWIY